MKQSIYSGVYGKPLTVNGTIIPGAICWSLVGFYGMSPLKYWMDGKYRNYKNAYINFKMTSGLWFNREDDVIQEESCLCVEPTIFWDHSNEDFTLEDLRVVRILSVEDKTIVYITNSRP